MCAHGRQCDAGLVGRVRLTWSGRQQQGKVVLVVFGEQAFEQLRTATAHPIRFCNGNGVPDPRAKNANRQTAGAKGRRTLICNTTPCDGLC
jgi:hypothetical protein